MAAKTGIHYSVVMRPDQIEALRKLSKDTRVPLQEYAREAIDDLLRKYSKKTARRGAATPRRA